MNPQPTYRALVALIHRQQLETQAKRATDNALAYARCYTEGEGTDITTMHAVTVKLSEARAATLAAIQAAEDYKRLPAPARRDAESLKQDMETRARHALRLGGDYSGTTETKLLWSFGPGPYVDTSTCDGDPYPGRNRHYRTDAIHTLTLTPDTALALAMHPAWATETETGYRLIGAHPETGELYWVETGPGGKALKRAAGYPRPVPVPTDPAAPARAIAAVQKRDTLAKFKAQAKASFNL